MKTFRKILFTVFEFASILSFIVLAGGCDSMDFRTLVISFCIFAGCAVTATFLDSPNRYLRVILPAILCIMAIIHAIFRPIIKLFANCYKTMKKSGGISDFYYDMQYNYDVAMGDDRIVEEDDEDKEYYTSYEDYKFRTAGER